MTSTDVELADGTGSRRPGKRIDWEAAKAAYIEGFERPRNDKNEPIEREWPTLADVAHRFGCNVTTVRKRSADERWPEQRASYQARLAHSRRQQRALALTKEAIDFDSRALQAAKLGMTMVQTRLAEVARDVQRQNALRMEAERRITAGLPVLDMNDLKTVIDARELNTLGQAAQQFQSLAAKALGEDIIRHEHTGADGGAIEVEAEVQHTVTGELLRDDPDRMMAVLEAMERAGLLVDNNNIVDAEVDEDDD